MPPSQLIIDFNRCFEPNPFNTGPSIPSKQTVSWTPLLSHVSLPDIHRGDTPDLTASPSSSVSSVLPLESEEIKKIFSFPAYEVDAVDPPQRFSLFEQYGLARSAEFYQNHSPFPHLRPELYQAHVDDFAGLLKGELNPHAPAFVPTFSKPLPNHIEPALEPEPLDLPLTGFQGIPLSENVSPPPGLPHPPAFQTAQPSPPHPANVQPAPCIGPAYFPLLLHASLENTTFQERADLMCTLVRSREHWSMECLLELAQHISVGALFPGGFVNERGDELPACAPSRYVPAQPQQTDSNIPETNERMRPEGILADITKQLYIRFRERHGDDCAQAFLWNVRELVLVQFKQSWDSVSVFLFSSLFSLR
jgi:hypothetical protein